MHSKSLFPRVFSNFDRKRHKQRNIAFLLPPLSVFSPYWIASLCPQTDVTGCCHVVFWPGDLTCERKHIKECGKEWGKKLVAELLAFPDHDFSLVNVQTKLLCTPGIHPRAWEEGSYCKIPATSIARLRELATRYAVKAQRIYVSS